MRVGNRTTVFRWAMLSVLVGAALVAGQVLPRPAGTTTGVVTPAWMPEGGPVADPNLKPVQRLEPPVAPAVIPDSPDRNPSGTTVPTGISSTPGRGTAAVIDPPPPTVQLQVRTPSHLPVGKPVPYRVTATNTSQAKALRVNVRMPWPNEATGLLKVEPKPDRGGKPGEELVWTMPALNRGESKTFDVEFQPKPDAKQVSAVAYVSFEYGARVDTAIDKPKVTVKRTATPQVAVGELITVKVDVTNSSPVPVPNAVLQEFVPRDVEIRGDSEAARVPSDAGQLRDWKLGTIAAGQTKSVTYQLLARKGGDVLTKSFLTSDAGSLDTGPSESVTKVMTPALQLKFDGPPSAESRTPTTYTATVTNAGTMPLENVRVSVEVPDDLSVVRLTNGCRTDRGLRTWVIPKLAAGESHAFRVGVEPEQGASGNRTLKAYARDSRGKVDEQAREATTTFVGRADLTWKPTFNPASVKVGRQGTLTVKVTNHGSETDKGVRLRVSIPPEVKIVETGPDRTELSAGGQVVFPARSIAPGKTVEFTVTYQGQKDGQARFELMLEGQSLNDKPLQKHQTIEVGQ